MSKESPSSLLRKQKRFVASSMYSLSPRSKIPIAGTLRSPSIASAPQASVVSARRRQLKFEAGNQKDSSGKQDVGVQTPSASSGTCKASELQKGLNSLKTSPELRPVFRNFLSAEINTECTALCNGESSFKNTDKEALEMFSFRNQEEELKEKAPTLHTCLKAAATNPNLAKRKTKSYATIMPGILTAASTVLYLRNREVNAMQTLSSLTLKRGGATSKTFARLHGRGVAISYQSTLRRQTTYGKNFDAEVLKWKKEVEKADKMEKELLEIIANGDSEAQMKLEKLNQNRHPGYSLNGDNVDVRIKPRQQSMEDKAKDLHYYQLIAVKNRIIDFNLSNVAPTMNTKDASLTMFVPNPEDNEHLRQEWATLAARIISTNVPALSWIGKITDTTIPHQYMEKTKQKSTVINLGVITEDENTHEGIVAILDVMNKYMPTIDGIQLPTLSGGDLLTCERQMNAKRDRQDSKQSTSKWEGVVPIIDDFHAMANFLEVIWKILYSTMSARDPGTLFAARNFLRATNVPSNPIKDVNAAVEFLNRYVDSLLVAAALQHFGMQDVHSVPSKNVVTEESSPDEVRKELLKIIDAYAIHEGPEYARPTKFMCSQCKKEYIQQKNLRKHIEQHHPDLQDPANTATSSENGVFNYSCAALSLGLLWKDFEDARKFGDGERIIRLYKYLMLYYRLEGKKKYALQSLRLLVQVQCMLSPRLAHQLVWNRTVNNQGEVDSNVETDRENEHHNRNFKDEYRVFHGKVSKASVDRVSHCAQTSDKILRNLDRGTHTRTYKGAHKSKDLSEDVQKLAHHLHREKIFVEEGTDDHHAFPSFPRNPLSRLDVAGLQSWMTSKLKEFSYEN